MHVFVCCGENRENHRSGSLPLAAAGEGEMREEGRDGRREAGEGVDEVSKDSCIAELYLLQNTIWTVSALQ